MYLIRRLAEKPGALLVERDYRDQAPKQLNERPAEFAYVMRQIEAFAPKTILDVGTGTTALPAIMRNCGPHVTAIDNRTDYWTAGMTNRHWHVLDEDIRAPRTLTSRRFDMVTCVSVLEHITPADAAVANMLRLLNPGGALVLTFPYHETRYVADVYKLPTACIGKHGQYITQQFCRADLDRWFGAARIVDQEYRRYFSGEAWACGGWTIPPSICTVTEHHDHVCLTVVAV